MFMPTKASDDRIAFRAGAGVSAAGNFPMFCFSGSFSLLSTHTLCMCVCARLRDMGIFVLATVIV